MGVRVFNIDEAKANLSKLVDAAIAGEEIIIARNGRRLVKMLRYDEPSESSMRNGFASDPTLRLAPLLSRGNVAKVAQAPVLAIVAADLRYDEHLERLSGPLTPEKRASFADPERAPQLREFAFTNATLQGAYLMLAARAVGLDVAPIGGFDRPGVDAAFFPTGRFAAIWLVLLGYADESRQRERQPRLPFEEVASFV